ncbi:MAG: TIGR01621 family pseudouridine synthase [Marinobacterium sp.]
MTLQRLFDHTDFMAIYKPIGVGMHSEAGEAGLQVIAEQQFGLKLWMVHRLDKVTSGVLLFAKSAETAAKLSTLFSEHAIQKTYLALSHSKPKRKQGRIKGDMTAARNGSYKLLKTESNPAVTDFFTLSVEPGLRLFVCRPKTGKTHQIRVALKSEGSGILGDQRYGEPADRTYLHAWRIEFLYQNEAFKIEAGPIEGEWFNKNTFKERLGQLKNGDLWPEHWQQNE